MVDISRKQLGLKLGSKPLKYGALDLEKYIADPTIVVPSTLARPADATGYQYGMLDNDTYGDCVAAAAYHMQETFRLKENIQPHPWLAATCLAWYFAVNQVPPGPPGSSSDQGTDPSTAMQYWQTTGLPGHKLAGFGALQSNSANIKRAIWEFGAVMFAVALPVTAQSQGVHWRYVTNSGDGSPGSWGGHGICGDSFTEDLLGFISWGEQGDMDNEFWATYGEQILVPLSVDQISKGGVGPAGFDFSAMQKDLPTLS
jgi:hypothetical protein